MAEKSIHNFFSKHAFLLSKWVALASVKNDTHNVKCSNFLQRSGYCPGPVRAGGGRCEPLYRVWGIESSFTQLYYCCIAINNCGSLQHPVSRSARKYCTHCSIPPFTAILRLIRKAFVATAKQWSIIPTSSLLIALLTNHTAYTRSHIDEWFELHCQNL